MSTLDKRAAPMITISHYWGVRSTTIAFSRHRITAAPAMTPRIAPGPPRNEQPPRRKPTVTRRELVFAGRQKVAAPNRPIHEAPGEDRDDCE